MTVLTPGWAAIHAIAAAAGAVPGMVFSTSAENSRAAVTPCSKSTPEKVSPTSNALPSRL